MAENEQTAYQHLLSALQDANSLWKHLKAVQKAGYAGGSVIKAIRDIEYMAKDLIAVKEQADAMRSEHQL